MNRHPDPNEAIRRGQLCPYCGEDTVYLKSSEEVYRKDYGPIYACRPCRAWVGCHKGGSGRRSLGRVADKELRDAKVAAHSAFDVLWKKKVQKEIKKDRSRSSGLRYLKLRAQTRTEAYQWLSEAMGLPVQHTHIGMFDVEQCRRVVELCQPYLKPKQKP
jgi:hypothetical protein